MILPNIAWNLAHDWATVGHTADNVNWQGLVLHPDELAAFLGAQFGVFGPVFFAALLLAVPCNRRMVRRLPEQTRLLLAFSLPILLVICGQALLSRANANWAAAAYPAATVLVAAWLCESKSGRRWFAGSVALHLATALIFYLAIQVPGPVAKALGKDPFRDLRGWDNMATDISVVMDEAGTSVLLMDNRMMIASMAYALRDRPDIRIRAWNHDTKIDHHYELAWRYDPDRDGGTVLLVTPHGTDSVESGFRHSIELPDIKRVDLAGRSRTLELRRLEEPK